LLVISAGQWRKWGGGQRVKIYRWSDFEAEDLGNGVTRKQITGTDLKLAQIFVPGGTSFPRHCLPSEQITLFVKGRASYATTDEFIDAQEGDIVHIDAGVEHQDEVLEDTLVVEIELLNSREPSR
jgi:quercetin dioxygenase-like cupin family protein